ncbi:MAG: DUF6441 family protein [Kiloniellales bacterium]|nr:DUF6441 family protein [Kiloniellales bacterium]
MRLAAALVGNLEKHMEAELRAGEQAVTNGVRDASKGAQTDLRRMTAVFGRRLPRTWRLKQFPRGKASLGAAALVFSKAPQIMLAFSRATVIRSKDGFFLAIPTPAAPRRGVGGKRINPTNFPVARFGPLRFVFRRGAPSLLVVDGLRASISRKTGALRGFRKASARAQKSGKGLTTVVMFILVPQVRTRKRIDIQRAAVRALRRLPSLIVRNWQNLPVRQ